jgi:hypothetical protein
MEGRAVGDREQIVGVRQGGRRERGGGHGFGGQPELAEEAFVECALDAERARREYGGRRIRITGLVFILAASSPGKNRDRSGS